MKEGLTSYLNLALAAHTDYLVTRDNDILDLSDPASTDGWRLRELRRSLVIMDPVRFLREILGTR
jgi:predicted nucleic acid-binding protein